MRRDTRCNGTSWSLSHRWAQPRRAVRRKERAVLGQAFSPPHPKKKGGLGPSVYSRVVSLGEAKGRENQIQNDHTI